MKQDMDVVREAAETVIKECFWGDYSLTPETLVKRFESGDDDLKRLVFSKIIANSSHPSRYIRMLYAKEEVETLVASFDDLHETRIRKRIELVKSNVLQSGVTLPEYAWKT